MELPDIPPNKSSAQAATTSTHFQFGAQYRISISSTDAYLYKSDN